MSQVRDIVVIGASLGGVTAIAKLALAWPAHLPAAVIVALTVPGEPAQSVLQVLEGYAPVEVAYASEGEAVRLRRIYLSPPNKHLFIGPDGLLNLDSGNAFDATRPSIDRLFTSAASVFGSRVIGILLSGNSNDGARGLMDIETAGGVGIVQEPSDAVDPRMPRHAIEADSPHYCIKAADMAALVQSLITNGSQPAAG